MLRNSRTVRGLGKKPGFGILGFQSDVHLWGALGGDSWHTAPCSRLGAPAGPGLFCSHSEEVVGRSWGIPPWNDSTAFLGSPPSLPPRPQEPQTLGMCLELGKALGSACRTPGEPGQGLENLVSSAEAPMGAGMQLWEFLVGFRA